MPRFELTQKWKKEHHVWRELPEGSSVVIYGRHSPGESQSIDSQAHAMRRWVEERGWLVAREFYDEGIEGSRDDRLAFQEMLAFLHQTPRPAEGIVTWNTSRFGRDQLDSQFYKADLRRRGYVILGKEDGIEQSPLAPVLESMLEWKAQQDLAVIGADTKRGLEYLALQGYWPGGPLPIGYVSEKELLGHRKNGAPRYGNRIRKDPAVADRIQRA
jgi:DNA invertase Pin-like site-specific DNA recombinase